TGDSLLTIGVFASFFYCVLVIFLHLGLRAKKTSNRSLDDGFQIKIRRRLIPP
ncbi:Hypothetical protein FKW44_022569, partial [Caligus rogercresseyi]